MDIDGDPVEPAATPDTGSDIAVDTTPEADPWEGRTRESLIDEVRKNRDENKKYRERWAPYEKTFANVDPALASDILDFADAVAKGDGATYTAKIAGWADQVGLTKAEQREVAAQVADADAEEDGPLTKRQIADIVKGVISERDEEQAEKQTKAEKERQARDVQEAINRQAKELGYDPEKDRRAWNHVFAESRSIFEMAHGRKSAGECLAEAHEALEAYKQEIVDGYIAGKKGDAQRVPSPAGVGTTAVSDDTPKSLDEAFARHNSRLKSEQVS